MRREQPDLRAGPRCPAILRPADRSVGCGRAQQPRRPLLPQGSLRGGRRRVHARARARPEDAASPSAISRSRTSAPATTTGAWRRCASSCAPLRTTGTRGGSWGARTALLGRFAGGDRRVHGAPAPPSATISARSCSWDSPRKRRAISRQAQHWFERALALDPDSPVMLFYIGEVLYNRGPNDEALAALERAIARHPDNPDAHYLMGFVLGDMGRHEEAREATKRAVHLNPTLAARRPTCRSTSTRSPNAELAPRRPSAARMARWRWRMVARWRTSTSGLAFRQKGYYAEALREYELALERGEERDLVQQAIAEVHLLRKDVTAGGGGVRRADRRAARQSETVERARRRAAPGRPLRGGGRELPPGDRRRPALRDRPQQPRRGALSRGRFSGRRGRRSAPRWIWRPTFAQARLNLALLLFKAKRLPAERRGVPPGAGRRAGARGGVERRRAGADGAAAVRRSAQCLRPRGPEPARIARKPTTT